MATPSTLGSLRGRDGVAEVLIRKERPADYREVEEAVRTTFWNLYRPGCDEHYLVHVVRDHPDLLPDLNLVAELDGRVVGGIVYTRSFVTDVAGASHPTLTFGPLWVLPEYQRRGIGKRLVEHSLEVARERGEKAVIILGHPRNYCRLGFKNARDFGVRNAEGRYPFGQLVREIVPGFFAGKEWTFACSPVFDLDQNTVAAFDAEFPPLETKWQPSQEEFSIAVRAYLD